MSTIPRVLMHAHRLLPDSANFYVVENDDSSDFAENDIVVVTGIKGSGVFKAKLAAAGNAADIRDGYLLACEGPIKQGESGQAVRRKAIPFDTSSASGENEPVYLHGTTGGALALVASSDPRQVGLVLDAPATVANGGKVLFAPQEVSGLVQGTSLGLSAGAEVANVIPVTVSGPAQAAQYVARVYDADMLLETAANYTLAETGVGAEVSTTAKASLLFTTDANGDATISVTDVSGTSTDTLYLEVSPMGGSGSLPAGGSTILAITFS